MGEHSWIRYIILIKVSGFMNAKIEVMIFKIFILSSLTQWVSRTCACTATKKSSTLTSKLPPTLVPVYIYWGFYGEPIGPRLNKSQGFPMSMTRIVCIIIDVI